MRAGLSLTEAQGERKACKEWFGPGYPDVLTGPAEAFARLAGLAHADKVYRHQVETFQQLAQGNSVLLHAPTGSGKSEAAFIPYVFLREDRSFPHRFIYVLPMRALVDSLFERFAAIQERALEANVVDCAFRLARQHGMRPESALFYADAIVATLDQVLSSYVCTPLSLGVRHGNIPAGAIASSWLVFDEIHTFDPHRGLQAAVFLAHRCRELGIPVVIMSATLPRSARKILVDRLALQEVQASEEEIPCRKNRRVMLRFHPGEFLTAQTVQEQIRRNGSSRVIVVCNTVDRAIRLSRDLKGLGVNVNLLLHSRHLPEDRQEKSLRLHELLGKAALPPDGEAEGQSCRVVVATQVIEVGLDISCDLLLTELAPIDALIQRVGRCARWAETPGQVIVFDVPDDSFAPYDHALCRLTRDVLAARTGELVLTWRMEQELIDEVLDTQYLEVLEPHRAGYAIGQLAKAAFCGDRRAAERAVRESDSAEVSLCSKPEDLRGQLRLLPSVSISVGTLKRFVRENPGSLLRVDDASGDRGAEAEKLVQVVNPADVVPFARYIATSGMAYSGGLEGEGLLVRVDDPVIGSETDWSPIVVKKHEQSERRHARVETIRQHVTAALDCLRNVIGKRERYGLSLLERLSNYPLTEISALVEGAIVIHDLGKLTVKWQTAARNTISLWWRSVSEDEDNATFDKIRMMMMRDALEGRVFLARFPYPLDGCPEPVPPHATVGAYIAWEYFKKRWGNFGIAALLAAAHHHSVRAEEVPAFKMEEGWRQEIAGLCEVASDLVRAITQESQRSSTRLPERMPAFHNERLYTFYVIVARCLSLADRMAAGGGEDAILDYEEWFCRP